MKVKPWTKVGRIRTLSKRYGRKLKTQKFINPIGGAIEEFSFFSCNMNSIIIFPITRDKKVVAIKQFRQAANGVFIELPGGNKHPNESPVNTAKRELLEETGFSSRKIIELKPSKVWVDASAYDSFYIPCLAIDCRQTSEPKLDATECIETITIPINEWLGMIREGLITDCKTLAITLLALPHVGIM